MWKHVQDQGVKSVCNVDMYEQDTELTMSSKIKMWNITNITLKNVFHKIPGLHMLAWHQPTCDWLLQVSFLEQTIACSVLIYQLCCFSFHVHCAFVVKLMTASKNVAGRSNVCFCKVWPCWLVSASFFKLIIESFHPVNGSVLSKVSVQPSDHWQWSSGVGCWEWASLSASQTEMKVVL